MMKLILSIACLVTMVTCMQEYGYPYYHGDAPYYNGYYGGFPHNRGFTHNRWIYYGQFRGSCEGAHDGLYFVDEYSFAYCSNGQKYIQPCAEGSANPPVANFNRGNYYGFYDFCSVNLVDFGYNAHQRHHAPSHINYEHKAVTHHDKIPHGKQESYQVHESKAYHKDDGYHGKQNVEELKTVYKKHSYEAPKKAAH